MKILAVKHNNEIKTGSIIKIAEYVGVHPNSVSRWISSGDRLVIKNGFEIYLNVEKL